MNTVSYTQKRPTCGGDRYLPATDYGQSLSTNVAVDGHADCDDVINQVCNTAVAHTKFINENDKGYRYESIKHSSGTCEGYWIYGYNGGLPPIDYHDCVRDFQSIALSCIVDKPTGSQFGVLNALWAGPDAGNWNANAEVYYDPDFKKMNVGYLLGAKGLWGSVDARDVKGFNADGSPNGVRATTNPGWLN